MQNDLYRMKTTRIHVAGKGNNAEEGYQPTKNWGFDFYFDAKNNILKASMLTIRVREFFNHLLFRYSYQGKRNNVNDFIVWANNDDECVEFLKENGIEKIKESNIAEIFVVAEGQQTLYFENKNKILLPQQVEIDRFKAVRYAKKFQTGRRELIDAEDRGEAKSKCVISLKGLKIFSRKNAVDEEIVKELKRVVDLFAIRGSYEGLSKMNFLAFANKNIAKTSGLTIVGIDEMQIIIEDLENHKAKGLVVTNDEELGGEAY